jgi:pimeloyl-ACP methyl ester carboxylesterase
MRNHGDSPWHDSHGYEEMAADLAQVIDAHGGQADLLGHSMGGKAAMAAALLYPGRVARLIVADMAPVAYGHAASQRANITAMRALDLTGLTSRAEADRRLAAHLDDPMLRGFFLHSLDLRADPPRWRLNLDVLDRDMDRIVGWPDSTARFDGPALFVAGATSAYVLPEHRRAILAAFPAARLVRIPGAGHWLHADRPEAFAETVAVWLARTDG